MKPVVFACMDIEEVLALPDPQWLIEGMLLEETVGCIYGPTAVGKSFLTLDWAMHVATGKSWQGLEVSQGTPVYVYAEGVYDLKYRVLAWIEYHGLTPDDVKGRIKFIPVGVPLGGKSPEGLEQLVSTIDQAVDGKRPNLILFDTLARTFGDGDENATGDIIPFLSAKVIYSDSL